MCYHIQTHNSDYSQEPLLLKLTMMDQEMPYQCRLLNTLSPHAARHQTTSGRYLHRICPSPVRIPDTGYWRKKSTVFL